jgi:glycosyltransferase involved in cell wall biosynthesis
MTQNPSPRKKILYLARWYPNRYDPMPGLFIRRHALSVLEYFDVSTLSVHLNFEKNAAIFEKEIFTESGLFEVKIYTRSANTGIPFFDSLVNIIRFFQAHFIGFRQVKHSRGNPDLLHVNVLTRCGIVALLYRLFKGVPYVVTEHWTRYLPGMGNYTGLLRKMLTRIVVKHASAILPVTLNLQVAMEKHGLRNNKYCVIPNVVDTNFFKPATQPLDKETKRILHVSCFEDKQKNISGILRVLAKLAAKRQDWKCIMVGDGIHFEKLKVYAGELNLKDIFVFFTGLRENTELVELMQLASFQVLFSRDENLPVVIPESFACGVPFISTNVGGISEHLHESLGMLIHSEDEDALLNSIEQMLDHPERYNKDQIRRYAIDNFSKQVIGEQLRNVYLRVLE